MNGVCTATQASGLPSSLAYRNAERNGGATHLCFFGVRLSLLGSDLCREIGPGSLQLPKHVSQLKCSANREEMARKRRLTTAVCVYCGIGGMTDKPEVAHLSVGV